MESSLGFGFTIGHWRLGMQTKLKIFHSWRWVFHWKGCCLFLVLCAGHEFEAGSLRQNFQVWLGATKTASELWQWPSSWGFHHVNAPLMISPHRIIHSYHQTETCCFCPWSFSCPAAASCLQCCCGFSLYTRMSCPSTSPFLSYKISHLLVHRQLCPFITCIFTYYLW